MRLHNPFISRRVFLFFMASFLLCPIVHAFAGGQQPAILVSSCATSINHQTNQTVHNIRLAVSKLSGKLLEPGQVFSFNETVGEITAVAGYQQAPVLLNGERNDVSGGGICQVSSTLYCAVLQIGLEIVERYRHSSPVTYLPLGQDATIAWGQKDLKFKNTSEQTLMIKGEIVGGRLIICIHGERKPEHSYELRSEVHEIPPPETGKNLTPALEALVYRIEMKNNEAVCREFLYRDYYPSYLMGQ